MESKKEELETPDKIEDAIAKMEMQAEEEKEEKLVSLIIEVVVASTLQEYYETSNKIS